MSPAPVLSHADLTAAGYIPEGTDRRALLRTLAEEIEDWPVPLAARLIRRNTDPALTAAERDDAWQQLRGAVDLLDACQRGAIEWRHIAPGAPGHSAATIGLEALEQDITAALDLLCGACPDETCTDGVHYIGRHHPDTGEDIESGACPRAERGSAGLAAVLLVSIFGGLLLLAAIALGQNAMCAVHNDALRYCDSSKSEVGQ